MGPGDQLCAPAADGLQLVLFSSLPCPASLLACRCSSTSAAARQRPGAAACSAMTMCTPAWPGRCPCGVAPSLLAARCPHCCAQQACRAGSALQAPLRFVHQRRTLPAANISQLKCWMALHSSQPSAPCTQRVRTPQSCAVRQWWPAACSKPRGARPRQAEAGILCRPRRRSRTRRARRPTS